MIVVRVSETGEGDSTKGEVVGMSAEPQQSDQRRPP